MGLFQNFVAGSQVRSKPFRSKSAASRAADPQLGAESLESRAMMAAFVRSLGAGMPDLAAASDSGWSATDNRTNVTTPTFSGTVRGAAVSVNLFDGQTQIGTAPVVNGVWAFVVDPAGALPQGRHAISAQAIDADGNFGPRSRALPLEVITAAPVAPTVGIDPRSDSGAKGDGFTNLATPIIGGVAPVGSYVVVKVDGGADIPLLVGRRGAWSFRPLLADGSHTVTALAENAAGLRSTLSTFSLTVDSLKPTAALAFIEADNEVEVRFSRPVSGVDAGDFRITGVFAGRPFDLPLNGQQVTARTGGFSVVQTDADGRVYRIRMNQPEIQGGTYSIRIVAARSGIFDKVAGNPLLGTIPPATATF